MEKSDSLADLAASLKQLDDDLLKTSKLELIEIDPAALRKFDAALFSTIARRAMPASNARRGAAVGALNACIDLIQSRDEWRQANLAAPLLELQVALTDLELGHVPPILEKPKSDGGRPAPFSDAAFRGYAAGIMGGLMRHGGMSKSRAAAWVAERLGAAGWSRVATNTVAGWRKEALENPRSLIGERYIVPIDRADWSDPIARAERLMTKLLALELKK